ncbi:putative fimbrial chaperone protein [Serratia marcescens]|uniref:fimbria/pilus chaperone family protein n=1 Tax=Serratia marcescens TaxID=615 RepID=UPI0021771E0D|nr:fimbria/pilus chaperone family protein [Serratia marcescens]CAI1062954.1 putative fimbrial chaperone protein [Serratia marcescens]CAI1065087.1 putative fimbrial chaperone protein [Serratia marcescens]
MTIKHSLMQWLGGACLMLGLAHSAGASFQLESMGIVLEENPGRVSFSIRNSSSEPILLATKVEDLDGKGFSKAVLLSPPIARIEAGQSQQVNFVLKPGTALPHEVMLKASFEGIGQAVDNSARMPVRQSIGLILQPKAVAVSKTPWDDLRLSVTDGRLKITNGGLHVVRLAPQLTLQPSGKVAALKNYYLMAGETQTLGVEGQPTSVVITPLSRYGFKQDAVTLTVK